jgi:hypothetical protein
MRIGPFKFATRKSTAVLAVAAFALRALIPSGFMLDSGHRLAIVICPDGFPADLLTRGDMSHGGMDMDMGMSSSDMSRGDMTQESMPQGHRHTAGHSHSEHCLFTSGSSSGPILQFAALASIVRVVREAIIVPDRLAAVVRFVYVPQSRAPPILP